MTRGWGTGESSAMSCAPYVRDVFGSLDLSEAKCRTDDPIYLERAQLFRHLVDTLARDAQRLRELWSATKKRDRL
jgi:hypothetical protein